MEFQMRLFRYLEIPNYENIIKASINQSDAVIIASEDLSPSLTKFIESSG